MTVSERVKSRFTRVEVLERVLAIAACIVFLSSLLFPFYEFRLAVLYIPECPHIYVEYMWAYKLRAEDVLHIRSPEEFWFQSYWSGQTTTRYDHLQLVLPLMFAAQILTVATALASIAWRKRIIACLPIFACLTVTMLMTSVNIMLSTANTLVDNYQIGYWLTYPSLALFILSFLFTLKPRQCQQHQTASSTGSVV